MRGVWREGEKLLHGFGEEEGGEDDRETCRDEVREYKRISISLL